MSNKKYMTSHHIITLAPGEKTKTPICNEKDHEHLLRQSLCTAWFSSPVTAPKGLWEDVGICRTPVLTDQQPGTELSLRHCGTGLYVSAGKLRSHTPPGQSQESNLAGCPCRITTGFILHCMIVVIITTTI